MPLLLLGIAALLISACSTPPAVAEFNATGESGNAPFEVSFVLGELADADSFSWDFGDGAGSDELEPTHVFENAGIFVVRLTATRGDSVVVDEMIVSVEPGEAGWIVLDGGQESISSFETAQYSAIAFDVLGNPIENPDFKWSVDESAGDISQKGKFTAGTDLGSFRNVITVELERLGAVVTQSTGIELVKGGLHSFSIEPTALDIQVGRTRTFSVEAFDEAGHALESALVLFTALREGDTVDSTGLFTSSTEASDGELELLAIEVELDDVVIEAVVAGTVRPGILDQAHISVLPTTLAVGESVQLTSFATDRFGNRLDLDGFEWSVTDPAIGSITDSGKFTAGSAAGAYTSEGITARGTLDDVESVTIAPVTITAGSIDSIHIIPESDSVPIGAGSPFVVLAIDAHGNIIEIDEDEYEYEYSTAGRGNEVAVFIAGYEIGDFENAITVTLPAGASGNETALVAQSDIIVRQRSSNIIAVEIIDQDGGGIFFIDLETAVLGSADISFHNNDAIELSPGWWPDGSRLVYVSDPTGLLQVYTLDLTTREIVQFTDVEGGVSMPNISPDAKSIVFVTLAEEQWQLYVAEIPEDVDVNPITLDMAVRISTDDTAQHILPYWSPDGSDILASQNSSDGLVQVMIFDPTATNDPQILGPFGSVGFGWTADGSGIHFGLATPEGALDLGTLDLVTLDPVFIEANLEFLVASWAPDDSELVAIDSLLGAGWLMDSDSTGLRRVVGSDQIPARMSWRPKEYGDPVAIPEFDGEPTMLALGDEPRGPIGALDTSRSYVAIISTDAGDIGLELYDDIAPMTVENFVNLARIGFYDGLEFHRVIEGFASQAGDNIGDGTGGPGYVFNDELSNDLSHNTAGVLSMANAGSNTNGSQFFITHDAANWLDPYEAGVAKNCADDSVSCHGIFGRVTSGLKIVTSMTERDPDVATTPGVKILGISILEN
ncbi:MAG TPA: PKD domain-containing protein [Dehalococcoidia bacterium]|nr:PKD domain-containing protein [Dehalococcoidia bacterium]